MAKNRKRNTREVRDRYLILCEGKETEPNYFRSIKSQKNLKNRLSALRIEVFDSIKNTPKELVKEARNLKKKAEDEKNPYKKVWVVVDRDGYTKHPQAFDLPDYNKSKNTYGAISASTQAAIDNAVKLRKHWEVDLANGAKKYNLNPYTDVDILVKDLVDLYETYFQFCGWRESRS